MDNEQVEFAKKLEKMLQDITRSVGDPLATIRLWDDLSGDVYSGAEFVTGFDNLITFHQKITSGEAPK